MSRSAPIVAIVGRANVGKSTLFNAVVGQRQQITAREAGTTRDSIYGQASWEGRDFWIVDTAGLKAAEDEFEASIQQQIEEAASGADIIWVTVDIASSLTDEDRLVAKKSLKAKKPVFLVANKSDLARRAGDDWQRLGIKEIFPVSAAQKRGLEELMAATAVKVPKGRIKRDDKRISLAILGRPNVGKSTLFNTLAKKQQAVVSERAGTTRDVNKKIIKYKDQEIELMDTAGIRRSGKINAGVEKFSVLRALAAIESADVGLLVLDAAELGVNLDQKIGGLIKEAGKGLIIAVNKWDSVEPDRVKREAVADHIAREFPFAYWAPLIFISAVTGANTAKIFELAAEIAETRQQKIKTSDLNGWLRSAVDTQPPAGLKNTQPDLTYMIQEADNPTPSFKIFGRGSRQLHFSYRRYLERSFRQKWSFIGTPVKFWFIDKKEDSGHRGQD